MALDQIYKQPTEKQKTNRIIQGMLIIRQVSFV